MAARSASATAPEWSINARTVIGWLEQGGYIRTEPDTGITDHALTTSQ